jgi:hypothetical protein
VEGVQAAGSNVTSSTAAEVEQLGMTTTPAMPAGPVVDSPVIAATEVENPVRNASAKGMSVSADTSTNAVAPELDRARATAFADTVDALYGVIADQRRAATDHSRRMKWMLSIVVVALLVTVAIGITQTMLLMRLTRDSTAQQQRIEQMMLNQQATLSTLLDTDSATVSAPAIVPVAPAVQALPVADVAPRAATPAATQKHPARAQHAHKAKTPPAH